MGGLTNPSVISVNTKTGAVTLTASDVGAAPTASGVTNGDTHDHSGGDGAQIAYATLSGNPSLGTAASKNIPASGDASATEVVYGSDTRLSDARTPAAHNQAESTITFTDIATGDASTTAHGYALKVTAPSAGNLNVLGVANGETARADKLLLDATAPSTQAFGDSAAAGTSLKAARIDHKHALPSAPGGETESLVTGTVGTGDFTSTTTATIPSCSKLLGCWVNGLRIAATRTNATTIAYNQTRVSGDAVMITYVAT